MNKLILNKNINFLEYIINNWVLRNFAEYTTISLSMWYFSFSEHRVGVCFCVHTNFILQQCHLTKVFTIFYLHELKCKFYETETTIRCSTHIFSPYVYVRTYVSLSKVYIFYTLSLNVYTHQSGIAAEVY